MKTKLILTALLLLVLPSLAFSQFTQFGLDGRMVYSLGFYGGKFYAGTDDGVYLRSFIRGDTGWTRIGLKGKVVRAVYPHQIGPIGYGVTAGIWRTAGDTVSPLTYCTNYNDTSWAPTDSGMDRKSVNGITSIDGFLSQAICGETFAAGGGKLYRKSTDVWEKVFDAGIGSVNVVKADDRTRSVWIGGWNAISYSYLHRSFDKGNTWERSYPFPPLAGINSIHTANLDTSTLFVGANGSVFKSTNSGKSWDTTGLNKNLFRFNAMAQNIFPPGIYAGGVSTLDSSLAGLFRSTDGGTTWKEIQFSSPVKGITSMVVVPTQLPELNILYIGTLGSGVLRLDKVVSVPPEQQATNFALLQNYPNPFNPTTNFRFTIADLRFVSLKIYDVNGREVATLVNEKMNPGTYTVQWNATGFASGIYFYRLSVRTPSGQAGSFVETKKLILIR